jgi:hypothetical protein
MSRGVSLGLSDPCQITPTDTDQPCLAAEARMACPLAFGDGLLHHGSRTTGAS